MKQKTSFQKPIALTACFLLIAVAAVLPAAAGSIGADIMTTATPSELCVNDSDTGNYGITYRCVTNVKKLIENSGYEWAIGSATIEELAFTITFRPDEDVFIDNWTTNQSVTLASEFVQEKAGGRSYDASTGTYTMTGTIKDGFVLNRSSAKKLKTDIVLTVPANIAAADAKDRIGDTLELKSAGASGYLKVRVLFKSMEFSLSSKPEDIDLTQTKTKIVSVSGISVAAQPAGLTYTEGQKLDLSGLVVRVGYSNGSHADVTAQNLSVTGITTSPENGTVLRLPDHGKNITISYAGHTADTKALTVVSMTPTAEPIFEKEATGIAVQMQPKLTYENGQRLDLSDMSVTLTYNDGSVESVSFKKFSEKDIMTEPVNGTVLSAADNQTTVKVLTNGLAAETNKLAVKEKTAAPVKSVQALIDHLINDTPIGAEYDMNSDGRKNGLDLILLQREIYGG